jgi:hypothetical protein
VSKGTALHLADITHRIDTFVAAVVIHEKGARPFGRAPVKGMNLS